MTIVVSWISKEREFPTLWTVADSRLSKPSETEIKPLLDCGSKLFSIRIVCTKPDYYGHHFDDIYYSTTLGMAFAGSSLLALNLYAFISYTLGTMGSTNGSVPSMEEIAQHVNTAFKALLNNFIEINMDSAPCEVSIFGFCPIKKQHQLFHIRHEGKDKTILFDEFNFIDNNSMHLMGSHQDDILELILSKRKSILSSSGIGKKFWRSPLNTIEQIIEEQVYPDIGGKVQLGISYPLGFRLTPVMIKI